MLALVRRLPLVLAIAALLSGCGSGQTDEEAVRETVTSFGQATAAKDYERLCGELLAPSLLESLDEIGLPCRVALEQSLGAVEEPRLVIGAITVDGDKAQAEVRTSARGQSPSRDTLSLVRVDDRWRIADLGSGSGSGAGGSPEPAPTP
jgi:hypothetical protein